MPERIFDRRILFIIILVAGLLIGDGWLVYRNIRQLHSDTTLVTHNQTVISTLHHLSVLVTATEIAQRGYLITGELSYLDPYKDNISKIGDDLNEIERLTADNPVQKERLPSLRAAINDRLKTLHENLSLRTEKGLSRRNTRIYLGQEEMDKIRTFVDQMVETEENLLNDRSRQSKKVYSIALWSSLFACALCLVSLFTLLLLIRRYLLAKNRAAKILFQERELFRTTLGSIGDAVVTTDHKGCVTYLNAIAQTLTGYTLGEAAGQPLDKILHIVNEQTGQAVDNSVIKVLEHGIQMALAKDTVLIAKDGTRRAIDDSAAPIKDSTGDIKGVVMVFGDVSEARKVQEEIRQSEMRFRHLAGELTKSNGELEKFAHIASHDLQEPLHVISSFADLLTLRCNEKMDVKEKEYVAFIKQAAVQARTLVKEILEYSSVGKENVAQVIDLNKVLKEVKANLRFAIGDSKAQVTEGILPDIHASHSEILQLFQNLILNAIKYAKPNVPPVIHISWSQVQNMYLFSIKDNGIGIEPQNKDRIFEMFQRLNLKTESHGTGIGLAICKKIVEAYGGKIWIESEPGQGSVFYFTLKTM